MSLHCSSRGPCGAPRAGAESSLLLCLRCHLGCCDPLFQFVLDFRAFPAVSSVIVHGEAGILVHCWRECKMVRLPWESWQFPQNRKQRRDLAVPFRAHAREEVKQGCEQTSARHPCRPRKGESAGAVGPEPGRSWPACRSVRRDVVPSETRPSREDARRPRPPTPGPKSGQSSQTRAQGQLWGGGVASGGWRGRVRKGPGGGCANAPRLCV